MIRVDPQLESLSPVRAERSRVDSRKKFGEVVGAQVA